MWLSSHRDAWERRGLYTTVSVRTGWPLITRSSSTYATTSLAELVYLLGKAIYDELKPRSSKWVDRFFRTVGSLRMGFKFDPVTGDPVLDISLGDIQAPQTTLDEIFRYL